MKTTHSMLHVIVQASGLALGLWAAAMPALARNTKLVLPIKPVLASPSAQRAIGSDVPVSFGSALPDGLSIVREEMFASAKFDPRTSTSPNFASGPPHTDEEACNKAFILAVADLAKEARRAKGTHLIGVVSNYDSAVMDSKDSFECRAGMTRVVVELKGIAAVKGSDNALTVSRLAAPVQAAQRPAAANSPAAAAATASLHRSPVPPATTFAEIDNVNAVPLTEAGRDRYRHYLSLPSPKAFVIFEGGQTWRFYHGDPDAMTKALDYCQSINKVCWLYAVDHRVVWQEAPARRISRSAQLGNE